MFIPAFLRRIANTSNILQKILLKELLHIFKILESWISPNSISTYASYMASDTRQKYQPSWRNPHLGKIQLYILQGVEFYPMYTPFLRLCSSDPIRKKKEDQTSNIAHTKLARSHLSILFFSSCHFKCSRHKKSKGKHRISNTIAVTTGGEEPHILVHCHRLLIAISVVVSIIVAAARRPPPTTRRMPPGARRPPLAATLCRRRTARQSPIAIAAARRPR
jgi:hypothetical protein